MVQQNFKNSLSIFICPTHRPCIIPLIINTIAIHRNAYKAPKPKPSPKKKKVDDAAAAVKRKKRIDMLSESPSRETRWPVIERSDLNADQDAAADIILNGANVFLTGWLVSCLIEDYSNHLTNLYPNQLLTHPSYSPYLPYPTYLPTYLPSPFYLFTYLSTYLPTYLPLHLTRCCPSILSTGSAGTGKSFLLRYLIQEFIRRHGEEQVAGDDMQW